MRNCNNCLFHTEKGCSHWDCVIERLENLRNVMILVSAAAKADNVELKQQKKDLDALEAAIERLTRREKPVRLVRAYKVLVTIQFADGDYSEEEYDGVLYRNRSEAEAKKIIAETCYGIEKARIIELSVNESVFEEEGD